MQSIEFEKAEQNKIWLLLKAILELGNVEFDNKGQEHGEEKPCVIVNREVLGVVAEVLEVKVEVLEKVLIYEKKVMPGQIIFKPYNKPGC